MLLYTKILCRLIEQFSPNGIGVEIGVSKGYTSNNILRRTSTQHLYMVDPWIWNFDKNQGLYSFKENPDIDYKYVNNYFSKHFPKKHTIIRKKSENATNDVSNNLDFIFIDGNHTYDYVKKDLEMWIPKVKSGGFISGHDWWSKFPGVIQAIIDYCSVNDTFLSPEHEVHGCVPAPAMKPIVMKSWPAGHIWWAIKK